MKKLLLILNLFFYSLLTCAQAPAIQWQKTLGGTGAEKAYSIQKTTDGGYIIAGESSSNDGDVTGNHGNYDCWIVKLDNAGTIQWQKTFGGTGYDHAYSIQQTADGGYVVAGYSNSNDGDVTGSHGFGDYWIVKLDNTGNIQWQKSLGGSNTDIARSVQQTTDGGYIIAGVAYSHDGDVTGNHGRSDYWIVKLDAVGNVQWKKTFGGTGYDDAYSIQQTTDAGYIIAGWSDSNDGDVTGNHAKDDYWIVKLNSVGAIQWQKSLGGGSYDYANSIQQTTDGGYIVAGQSFSTDGDVIGNNIGGHDYWIVKLNSIGAIQWQKSLGGNRTDLAYSIQQATDGGYIVAGQSASNDGDVTGNHDAYFDYWIVKLNPNGTLQWQKALGGIAVPPIGYYDEAYSVQQSTDGGYIVAGASESNNGDVTGNHGDYDYWIVKLAPDLSTEILENKATSFVNVFPNPANSNISVQLQNNAIIQQVIISDIQGKQYIHQKANENQVQINTTDLSKGMYLLTIIDEQNNLYNQKLIIK